MFKRVLVIHNPVAGRRQKMRLTRFLSLLQQSDFEVRTLETGARGDAKRHAATAIDIDIIIAAGGDGTINEVLNGLYQRASGHAMPALGFLPLGTANVLAWELDLPRQPELLFKLLQSARTYDIHPGIANGRRFFLMASAGLDARAVAAVTAPLKRKFGALAYLIGAFRALRNAAPSYEVTIDGLSRTANTVVLTRAQRYGGRFILSREAGLKEPVLQAVLFTSSGFGAALRYGLGLVFGRLAHHKDVHFVNASAVEISCEIPDPVQIDGDIVGTLPLTAALESRPIRFLAP